MNRNHVQFVCVCLALLASKSTAWAFEFAGGTGAANDPYQIGTAEQLVSIGSDPNLLSRHCVLVSDISMGSGRIFDKAVIAPGHGRGDIGIPGCIVQRHSVRRGASHLWSEACLSE